MEGEWYHQCGNEGDTQSAENEVGQEEGPVEKNLHKFYLISAVC